MRLPELTEGLHNLTVRVVFVYDNPSSEGYIVRGIHTESQATAYFRIDTTPQNSSILMPDILAILLVTAVSVATAGVLVYFKKRKH
jgi:hypothetical protein